MLRLGSGQIKKETPGQTLSTEPDESVKADSLKHASAHAVASTTRLYEHQSLRTQRVKLHEAGGESVRRSCKERLFNKW